MNPAPSLYSFISLLKSAGDMQWVNKNRWNKVEGAG